MPSTPEIEHLRAELHKAESALHRQEPLLIKREELQKHEDELKQQVQYLLAISSPLLKQNEELLSQVKHKKSQLDHLLDEFEENSDERVNHLQAQLAEKIVQLQPDKQSLYEELQTGLRQTGQLLEEVMSIEALTAQLIHLLESLLAVRQQIRRQGLWSYIFGSNPTAAITQYLQGTELLVRTGLPKVQKAAQESFGNLELRETYTAFAAFLETLQKECLKRWGFGRLDTVFPSALQELITFKAHFEKEQQALFAKRTALKAQLDAWLRD